MQIQPMLKACLDKDPKKRLRDIGDVWRLLEEPGTVVQPAQDKSPTRWLWPSVAAALVLALVAMSLIHFREQPPPAELSRFEIGPPPGTQFNAFFVLSPDGRKIAFTAALSGDAHTHLWVRSLDTLEAKLLVETALNSYPFWSPDSRSIGFQIDGKLKRIDIAGGPAHTLCDVGTAADYRGASWSKSDVIVFSGTRGLERVSASGGDAVPVATGRFPSFLPDGKHFLYLRTSSRKEDSGISVGWLDSKTEQQDKRLLLPSGYGAAYSQGYLLFLKEGTLMSQPFDAAKLALSGEAHPVAESVATANPVGSFTASDAGTLIYRTGAAASNGASRKLVWVDRQGKTLNQVGDPAADLEVVLSPDGSRVATTHGPLTTSDIWLTEFARVVPTRLTFNPASDRSPVLSQDNSRLIFASNRLGHGDLYQKLTNLAGDDELLFRSDQNKIPTSLSRDGRFLLFTVSDLNSKTKNDIWLLPMQGERKPVLLLGTEFTEALGMFSPDMRWIAYVSDESGASEIWVRSFSPPGSGSSSGGRWQVSRDGGGRPQWRADSKELFYVANADGSYTLMGVEVGASPDFRSGAPQKLFRLPPEPEGGASDYWAPAPDGKKFLVSAPADLNSDTGPAPIVVMQNWTAVLKK